MARLSTLAPFEPLRSEVILCLRVELKRRVYICSAGRRYSPCPSASTSCIASA